MESKFVAYYRVSTQKQGQSGLGIEAQQEAVRKHIGSATLLAEFTEVESGKLDKRPQLAAAMLHARVTGATLIVAKLDRLSRNATFLNQLLDSGTPLCCADMPFADRLTIGLLAQLAQWEREQISKRTKEALAAAKARGKALGGDRGNLATAGYTGRQASIVIRKANAAARKLDLVPYVEAARAAGHTSLQGIADYLNGLHIRTAQGGSWYAASVQRLLAG